MDYFGKYYHAVIDDPIYQDFEPVLILLDHDFDAKGLDLRVEIGNSNKTNAECEYQIKLIGRKMGIDIFLAFLFERLRLLSPIMPVGNYLIAYKDTKVLFNPRTNQSTCSTNGE